MLRCIDENGNSLIAIYCEEEPTRILSQANKLLCPNCMQPVNYKKGKVKTSHFAHKAEIGCEFVGQENETEYHVKGKRILYDWLKATFPTADVEYEVRVPETGQIIDVWIKHNYGEYADRIWAFEFQRSKISPTAWEERHNMYESVGIQDFWFFDKSVFMNFSVARGHTDARRRFELEKEVFSKTGFVHFLDLESSDVTIDFKFTYVSDPVYARGKMRPRELTYHSPKDHSLNIELLKAKGIEGFPCAALYFESLEKEMEVGFQRVNSMLEQKEMKRMEKLYQERFREKLIHSIDHFGKDFKDQLLEMLRNSGDMEKYNTTPRIPFEEEGENEESKKLKDDIVNLSVDEFFDQYKPLVDLATSNVAELEELKERDGIEAKVLSEYALPWKYGYNLTFLRTQKGNISLIDYLSDKYRNKVELVKYIWEHHRETLAILSNRRRETVNEKLSNIHSGLRVYRYSGQKATDMDYAIMYRNLESIEQAEECIQQIKDMISKTTSTDPLDPFSDIW